MSQTKAAKTYKITFNSDQPMTFARAQIHSPTIIKAIDYIEREPGCTGVALTCGTKIETHKGEKA